MRLRIGIGMARMSTLCHKSLLFASYIIYGNALAAGAFYQQRSWLAWFYGQISLSDIRVHENGQDVKEWLLDADSWATWVPYRYAFYLAGLGLGEYTMAMVGLPYFRFAFLVWLPFVVTAVFATPYLMILSSEKYKFLDEPLKSFLHSLFAK